MDKVKFRINMIEIKQTHTKKMINYYKMVHWAHAAYVSICAHLTHLNGAHMKTN